MKMKSFIKCLIIILYVEKKSKCKTNIFKRTNGFGRVRWRGEGASGRAGGERRRGEGESRRAGGGEGRSGEKTETIFQNII